MKIPEWLQRYLLYRASITTIDRLPDVYIGGEEDPYLMRWYMIPRNPIFNIYLHVFRRDDDDRALHDHPWWSLSLMVSGEMIEHLPHGKRLLKAGDIALRSARFAHQLELVGRHQAVTIFITGPRIREWGFHCPKDSPAGGWRHWREFTAENDSTRIGRGCD